MVIELIHLGCHWPARKYSSFLPDSSSALLVTKIVSVCLFRTTELALFGTWKRIRSPCWALLALSGNTYKLNRALLRKQIWVVNSAKRRTYIGQFGLVQSIWQVEAAKLTREVQKYILYRYLLESEGWQRNVQFIIFDESSTWLMTLISEQIFLKSSNSKFCKPLMTWPCPL